MLNSLVAFLVDLRSILSFPRRLSPFASLLRGVPMRLMLPDTASKPRSLTQEACCRGRFRLRQALAVTRFSWPFEVVYLLLVFDGRKWFATKA